MKSSFFFEETVHVFQTPSVIQFSSIDVSSETNPEFENVKAVAYDAELISC